VQAGKNSRFEVLVLGWGEGLESVVIDRFKIEKSARIDPDDDKKFVRIKPSAYLEDWDQITEKVIKKTYALADGSGRRMAIRKVACDSGGDDGVTEFAYQYYRSLKKSQFHRRFMLIKGRGSDASKNSVLVEKVYPDNTKRSDRKVRALGDVPVYLLLTNKIKDVVANAISRDTPGPRYMHYPDWLNEAFFDELMAEERDSFGKWAKAHSQVRNEAFDLYVYNWAIVFIENADQINWESPPLWAVPIEESNELLSDDNQAVEAPKRRRRRSSF
jgi:phage terminase large subunit GpA-like protein